MMQKSFSKLIGNAVAAMLPLVSMIQAVAVGALLCAGLALSFGLEPLDLIKAVALGSWGSPNAIATTLSKSTPLLLTGLAVALAFQGRLLNIGCEGQLTLGALTSASFAVATAALPWPLAMTLTILCGALAGALWALPAIWLKQHRNVHEVISTLLMNTIAINAADYLVRGPLGDGSAMGRTPGIPPSVSWPTVWQLGSLGVSVAPFVALFLALVVQVWLSRTIWGFEARAVGGNPHAARAAGISVSAWQKRLFLASGAIAGLAGALEILAVHHRFYIAFSPGYGFDGITAAFLVNTAPGWLWLSGLLLASLRAADKWLQLALGVSPNVILVLQAILLLAVACQTRLGKLLRTCFDRLLDRTKAREKGAPPGSDAGKSPPRSTASQLSSTGDIQP